MRKKMIAIIEDDVHIGDIIEESLRREGYRTCRAYSGTEAQYLLADQKAGQELDLILLDLMLPGLDGFDVCRSIREKCDTPVIMLTALGSESCQMRGYGLHIDDYITKPVSMALLLQKVEAVLRRTMLSVPKTMQATPKTLHFENIALDPDTHTVRVSGHPVELTLREYEILQELMLAPGSVVTRKTLIEKLWGYDFSISAHCRHAPEKYPAEAGHSGLHRDSPRHRLQIKKETK